MKRLIFGFFASIGGSGGTGFLPAFRANEGQSIPGKVPQ
ncbi:hypothetical protein ACP_2028 [Acidobacterium capsulatum ATCC 51196]|uniref:Uncharacterized protein n=1 Tax=Acidobacterium capsulatum (strain ATCC 51196 / DSM 11244 / BCRC 80197 / JCM 7670 / NBRC 15755 / NCIMB 13165 / 161) TaxID=240015 RepID=C1F8W9_ACIC5|nr:hypothetical protein ACP_2028 [Acidobacterium capsulatum ATCC 51196]